MGSETQSSTDAQQPTGDELFREAGKELSRALHAARGGKSMDEHVDSATDKLNDEEIVGFALVAIRKSDGRHQAVSQRVIDHEAVMEASDPERYVDWLHERMVDTFEAGVAEK